jgi:hypothetical protein
MTDQSLRQLRADGTTVIVVPLRAALWGFARRCLVILGLYAVFAAGTLAVHRYAAAARTPTAQALRRWYLQHDPDNGKPYHRGYCDWVMPCEILGVAAGIVLARSWVWAAELVLWSLVLSAGVMALMPAYRSLFPQLQPTSGSIIGDVFGALQCGFAIAVGRVITAYLLTRKKEPVVSTAPLRR